VVSASAASRGARPGGVRGSRNHGEAATTPSFPRPEEGAVARTRRSLRSRVRRGDAAARGAACSALYPTPPTDRHTIVRSSTRRADMSRGGLTLWRDVAPGWTSIYARGTWFRRLTIPISGNCPGHRGEESRAGGPVLTQGWASASLCSRSPESFEEAMTERRTGCVLKSLSIQHSTTYDVRCFPHEPAKTWLRRSGNAVPQWGLLRAVICTSQVLSLQAGSTRSTFEFKCGFLPPLSRWAAARTYNNTATHLAVSRAGRGRRWIEANSVAF